MKLSIIIATYNRAESLIRALNSIAEQGADPSLWEAVVVNNNSTDNTAQAVEEFISAHKELNLRLVAEPKQGLSNARNGGIAAAKGAILAFVDDDQTLVPTFVQSYIDFFDTNPCAMVAGGAVIPQYQHSYPQWMPALLEQMIANPIAERASVSTFKRGRIPAGGNMVFRREIFDRYGLFNPKLGRNGKSLIGGEESDLFARLRREGVALYFVPKAAIYHHIPDAKLTVEYIERLSLNVGKSKRLRAEADGKLCFLIVKESLKQVATYLIAAGYLICLKPKKAHFLLKMRRGIMAGVKSK